MKRCIVLLLLAGMGFVVKPSAQETARVTLTCVSLRFQPATTGAETLELTSDSSLNEINGEVFPLGDPTLPEYGTYFVLNDPSAAGAINGQIAFDLPPQTDANSDGFDDFFQVSQAGGPATTQGLFSTAVDKGTVTASWSRAAGSATGTCNLTWKGQSFGQLPNFRFTFELVSYLGTLTYNPSTNSIAGFLSVTNLTSSSNILSGPVSLVRSANDLFNAITLLPGTLTNAAGQAFPYPSEGLERDQKLKTNYFGALDFKDGDPSTSTPDYQSYSFSIDDTNDTNANGIPDLSDPPSGAPTQLVKLSLTRSSNQLRFNVSGQVGQSYDLEEIPALGQTNWTKSTSLTLTNNPQTITLPVPNSSPRFWRLRSP